MFKLQEHLPLQRINLIALLSGISGAYIIGGLTYFLGAVLYPDHASFKLILSLMGLGIGYGAATTLAGKFAGHKILPSRSK